MILLTLACLVAVAISFNTTYFLRTWLQKGGIMDVPNDRSSHTRPIPRGGGLGIMAGVLVGVVVIRWLSPFTPLPSLTFFLAWGLIAIISFLDDRHTLPAAVRFGVQALAATLVVWDRGGLDTLPIPLPFSLDLGCWGLPLAWFWIMAVLNLFNFMDGINGFAGVQAVLGGIFLAWIDPFGPGAVLGPVVALASLGFLYFNAGKASIFMGDVGSVSLGFFFAAMPFYAQGQAPALQVYTTVFILWFFLADGAFTLLRRIFKGQKPWEAHREHYYQQLVKSGWSHTRVVAVVMGTSGLFSLGTYLCLRYYPQFSLLPLGVGLVLMLCYWILVRHVRKSAPTPSPSESEPSIS